MENFLSQTSAIVGNRDILWSKSRWRIIQMNRLWWSFEDFKYYYKNLWYEDFFIRISRIMLKLNRDQTQNISSNYSMMAKLKWILSNTTPEYVIRKMTVCLLEIVSVLTG